MSIEWVRGGWSDITRNSRVRISDGTGTIEGRVEHVDIDSVLIKFSASQSIRVYRTSLIPPSTLWVPKPPIELPSAPGTVIAIGDWWLVRLRSYDGAQPAWELLPWHSKAMSERAAIQGVAAQCVYGDDWVRAEIEQDANGFVVISEPPAVDAKGDTQ